VKVTLSRPEPRCETHLTAEPFPAPDPASLAISESLVERIRAAADASGGWLGFDRFMQMALYEPGLGYYSTGSIKLGARGDFTTAPELSDWLAAALAPFVAGALGESRQVLELGAGSGRLARQLLGQLRVRGRGDVDYSILETSADLRARQKVHLETSGFDARWLDTLPASGFRGVVLANEVADAIPVVRFVKQGGAVLPLGVTWRRGELVIEPGEADPALIDAVAGIESELGAPLPDGYRSEVCLLLAPWLEAMFERIETGGLLLIDYGMPRRDYYRPERSDGTLICHYRHRAHANPLLWPGLQDLSAWVDFSAVAAVARRSGWTVAGYTTQAQFLLGSIASDPVLAARRPTPREASALQTLILPGEMGERFKLVWLARSDVAPALPGRDFRNWL
jgi:SAM-dependent MidA family methyltransferase